MNAVDLAQKGKMASARFTGTLLVVSFESGWAQSWKLETLPRNEAHNVLRTVRRKFLKDVENDGRNQQAFCYGEERARVKLGI